MHLRDWPETGTVDETVLREMHYTREVINNGLSQRAQAGMKVRQPLATAKVWNAYEIRQENGRAVEDIQAYLDIIAEELNVKQVTLLDADEVLMTESGQSHIDIDFELTPELKREGQSREVIRQVQSARKAAGLNIDDRISLELATHDANLQQAIAEHAETIQSETLATTLTTDGTAAAEGYTAEVTIDGVGLAIALAPSKQ